MIDSHCHLDFKDYSEDRIDVIKAAVDAGVHTIVNIGTDLKSSIRSIELADEFKQIYAAVGIHPHDASSASEEVLAEIKKIATNKRVVAIGEIGLDFYRDRSPRAIQKKAFSDQLEIAVQLNLPVVIHTREAYLETVEIIREFAGDLPGGVFHCFPGSPDEAFDLIDLGFVIGIGGIVTYKNSSMAKVASEIPLEKILLETDAPFLTPVPFRGKRNSPAYIPHIRDKIAELRSISPDEVEHLTDRASKKLFKLSETFEG